MKLLLIRHGDPDYLNDTLTARGRQEAEYLADRMEQLTVDACFVSPLGRAKHTADATLNRTGWPAVECDWLREFHAPIHRPDRPERESICWDWLPEHWTTDERFFDPERWSEHDVMVEGQVRKEYDRVAENLDRILADHGYVREGRHYRAERANHETLAFFCHFGVGCVMLSHLLGISPMILWQGFCAAPTSVTTLVTEERRPGMAFFRMTGYGDISHLYVNGMEPSFAARFCECYTDVEDRHD